MDDFFRRQMARSTAESLKALETDVTACVHKIRSSLQNRAGRRWCLRLMRIKKPRPEAAAKDEQGSVLF